MKKLIIFAVMLISVSLSAQKNTLAAGGKAVGSQGSACFSIGQIDYGCMSSNDASMTMGMQQPYEIALVTDIHKTAILSQVSVYPNPVTDVLNVNLPPDLPTIMTLNDGAGKLILTQNSTGPATVDMNELPTGLYYLQVSAGSEIKTYKLIKNK